MRREPRALPGSLAPPRLSQSRETEEVAKGAAVAARPTRASRDHTRFRPRDDDLPLRRSSPASHFGGRRHDHDRGCRAQSIVGKVRRLRGSGDAFPWENGGRQVRMLGVVLVAVALALAGCGSDDEEEAAPPTTTDQSEGAATTSAGEATPLDGTWRTEPITLDDMARRTLREQGLGKWVDEFEKNAPISDAPTTLILDVKGDWDLNGQAEGGGPQPVDYDAEYKVMGDTVVVTHADGSRTLGWSISGDVLELTSLEDTIPALQRHPGRGVPDGPVHDRRVPALMTDTGGCGWTHLGSHCRHCGRFGRPARRARKRRDETQSESDGPKAGRRGGAFLPDRRKAPETASHRRRRSVRAHNSSPEQQTQVAVLQQFTSRRSDSNRGPLHYERTTTEGRASTRGHVRARSRRKSGSSVELPWTRVPGRARAHVPVSYPRHHPSRSAHRWRDDDP